MVLIYSWEFCKVQRAVVWHGLNTSSSLSYTQKCIYLDVILTKTHSKVHILGCDIDKDT